MADTLSKAAVAFERIGEILDDREQRSRSAGRTPAPARSRGGSSSSHVRFGYNSRRPVLRGRHARRRAGPAGGAGRTDRQRQVDADRPDSAACTTSSTAQVLIDGRDVRSYTLQSLREQVSFVLQDTVLFHAVDCREHRLRPSRSDHQARSCARPKLANVDEFIARMPQGYDTIVGERGETLVGRPAAAHCDRARADPERADSAARRAVGGARPRVRAAGLRGPVTTDARPDVDHHRASPGDDPQLRRDLRAESRGHRRARHARRTARPQRALRALLPCAVSSEPHSRSPEPHDDHPILTHDRQ